MDEAQRSRKLGRFSAKVLPCLTLHVKFGPMVSHWGLTPMLRATGRHQALTAELPLRGGHSPLSCRQSRSVPKQPMRRQAAMGNTRRCSHKLSNEHTQVDVDAGTLVIQPLSVSQLREVTDLLTDVFEASEDAIGLYTRWMRGQIRQYLEHHIKVGRFLCW